MNWGSGAAFFSMGGYGLYVWGAYGVTAALLVFEVWLAVRRRRRAFGMATDALSFAEPRSIACDRAAHDRAAQGPVGPEPTR
ncbi:MAG: heme exporter protein CcmD [Caldimonas sp.]